MPIRPASALRSGAAAQHNPQHRIPYPARGLGGLMAGQAHSPRWRAPHRYGPSDPALLRMVEALARFDAETDYRLRRSSAAEGASR
jgi:hypothetical protein